MICQLYYFELAMKFTLLLPCVGTKLFICQSCGHPQYMQEITKLSSEVEEKLENAYKCLSSGSMRKIFS